MLKELIKANKSLGSIKSAINPKYKAQEADLNDFIEWYNEDGVSEASYTLDTGEIYLDETGEVQFILKQDSAFPKKDLKNLQSDLDDFKNKSKGFTVALNSVGDVCLLVK